VSEKLHIVVTEDHIKSGVRKDATSCPIALALQNRHDCTSVEVEPCGITFDRAGWRWKARAVPANAETFMLRFDEGAPVEPFEFDLEVVEVEP
jgi:hypothetical protein